VVSFGFTWIHLDSLGLTWIHLDSLGFTWIHLDSLGLTWIHLDSLGLTWSHLDSLGFTWTHLDSLGPIWMHFDSFGITWTHLHSPGFTRTLLGSLGLTWIHLDSLGFTRTHSESLGLARPHWNSLREKGKAIRGKRERQMLRMRFEMHFHLASAPRARTHDTKRFPGYGGACLKANSLPPTSDIIYHPMSCSKPRCALWLQRSNGVFPWLLVRFTEAPRTRRLEWFFAGEPEVVLWPIWA
jgi:hypothetical protein